MALSTPFILLLSSTLICLVNILFLPEILPNTKLTTLFALVTSTSFIIWGFWKAFIYPSWSDPLRHLPLAGVSYYNFVEDSINKTLVKY